MEGSLHITESLLDEDYEEDDLEDEDEPGAEDVLDSLQEMVASGNESEETVQPKEPPPQEKDIEIEMDDGGDKSPHEASGSTDDPKDKAGNMFSCNESNYFRQGLITIGFH